jgi:excisionase family DNA binding protein
MNDLHKRAFTVREFCQLYGMGRDLFYRTVRDRGLRAVKSGGKTLVLKEDAEKWASSLPELRCRRLNT